MRSDPLLAQLRALAHGRSDAFQPVATAMYEALQREDETLLNELHGRVMLDADLRMGRVLDGLMDMYCAEPVSQTYADERQWRVFAVAVLLRLPLGLTAARLDGMHVLQGVMAGALGVSASRVKCDPMMLPAWLAYDYGPLEAYQQCFASKVWAGGLLKRDLREELRNRWTSEDRTQGLREVVMLVNVYCNVDETQPLLQKLAAYAQTQPALMLEAAVDGEAPVPVKAMLVSAGSPWAAFNETLHTVDTYQLGAALRRLCVERGLNPTELSLLAAYVEEQQEDQHTLRVSVLNRADNTLLAGVLFCDLHEPEYFLLRADQMLEGFGCGSVHRLEPTFYEAELERDGDTAPRFFSPASGWQQPPALY